MKMYDDKIRILPYEPEAHWAFIYHWYHSGDYNDFFGNIPMMNSNNAASFNKDGAFIIVDVKDVKKVIGLFTISKIEDRHRNCHFGVLIDKKFQGNDIARKASVMMLYYIMNQMNMFKIIALVNDSNEVSKHITESFGFEKEGFFKQDVYFSGEFHDIIRYKITKGMFNKRYKSEKDKLVGA